MSMVLQAAHLVADHVYHLLADPTPTPAPNPGVINTPGIISWTLTHVAPILLCVIGVIVMSLARKGEFARVLTMSVIGFFGLALIAGAGVLLFAGDDIVKIVFGR